MLSQNQQRNYLEKRCKNIQLHLKYFLVSNDLEELHKLRVEIKKIKSLVFLLTSSSKNKKLEVLKQLFKLAGSIRTLQLKLAFLKENHISTSQQIQKRLDTQLNKFQKLSSHYLSYIQVLSKGQGNSFHDIKNKQLESLYKKRRQKVTNHLIDSLQQNKLHDYRKQIKYLLFLYRVQHSKGSKLSRKIVAFDELQKTIGYWHDDIVHSKLLKTMKQPYQTLIIKNKQQIQNDLKIIHNLAHNITA